MNVSVADMISQLLDEHEQIKKRFVWIEGKVSDLESAAELKDIRKKVKSERLQQEKWRFELETELLRIEEQLTDHFGREEDTLARCWGLVEDEAVMASLGRLRNDHQEILGRILALREMASETQEKDKWIENRRCPGWPWTVWAVS